MAVFCIPKHLVSKLKASALKGEIDVKNLFEMTSAERRSFFEKHTDKEVGKFINTEFEKAMVSKSKTALKDWAESVFSPKAKEKPVFKTVLDKINNLNELGVLSPSQQEKFLEDLVADKLGVSVTPDEVAVISKRAKAIQKAQESLGDNIGNPEKLAENVAFFKAKKQMDDYLSSLTPSSKLAVATGTIGRGMMLASVKSPILNIGTNTETAITEGLARRLSNMTFRGTDNGLAMDYVKAVNKIYKETGYDVSRMMNLSDTGSSGKRILGDTVSTQGPGGVRKAGRVVEDIVFKNLMGAPDTAFASVHFADSVNLSSKKMFKGDAVKAREAMTDAMRIKPQTEAGEILRAQGILDAQTSTFTNKTWASKVSESIRGILNEVSGDIRLGDFVMPFVKTPANVIAIGLDYAGLGFAKALGKTIKAIAKGELGSNEYTRGISKDLIRAGLGMVGAIVITNQLGDDDFVGAYDPDRKQIEQLRNSNTNSVRINGKWVSLDWFGPLGISIAGIMYARKYGDKPGEIAFQYGKGSLSYIVNLPGLDIASETVTALKPAKKTSAEAINETGQYAIDQLHSRMVPSLFADTAKAFDPKEREVGTSSVNKIKSKIPGARNTLPVKENIFAEEMDSEPGWSDIFFGSRVKTSRETSLISELSRLQKASDKSLSFTDWKKTTSKSVAEFREKMGDDKFEEARRKYGSRLKQKIQEAMTSPKYQGLSDDDRLKLITGLDTTVQNQIFKEYGFKATKAKPTKIEL